MNWACKSLIKKRQHAKRKRNHLQSSCHVSLAEGMALSAERQKSASSWQQLLIGSDILYCELHAATCLLAPLLYAPNKKSGNQSRTYVCLMK
jgi:hypothetical protein